MNVAELSDAVKQLVAIFDDWNQQESDTRSTLMMVQAAKDSLSRQIIQQIRNDKAEAEKPAEVAPAADTVEVAANDIAEVAPAADTVAITGDAAE